MGLAQSLKALFTCWCKGGSIRDRDKTPRS